MPSKGHRSELVDAVVEAIGCTHAQANALVFGALYEVRLLRRQVFTGPKASAVIVGLGKFYRRVKARRVYLVGGLSPDKSERYVVRPVRSEIKFIADDVFRSLSR